MKKIKFYFRDCRGFTLSELLAVAVILAILAVMAMGSFRLAIEKARFTEGLQAAEKVAAALERFYYENPSLPYGERIYPTMGQLALSFTNQGTCHSVFGGGDGSFASEAEARAFAEEKNVLTYYIDEALKYEDRCIKVGDFEIGPVRENRGCATAVTAIRGGSRQIRYECTSHLHYNKCEIDFGYAPSGTGRFTFKDYIISVYPSFFDGSVGLHKCLDKMGIKPISMHSPSELYRKKVSCTGLERMCATMGFTENLGVLNDGNIFNDKYASIWVRP